MEWRNLALNYKTLDYKALPGEKPSNAIGVTCPKENPMRRDLPVLFTARMHQYTWLSKTQVSKYKIIISDSSLYTYWCVSLNGLLSPQPLLGPGCFRGSITWQRRAPLPSLVVVLISVQVILAAKYSRNHPFTRYSGLSQVHRAVSATCQLINTFF